MKRVQSVFLSLRGSRMGDAVRLLRTSGSPRAFLNALAMTGVGERARDDNYSNFLNSSTLNPASRTIPPSVFPNALIASLWETPGIFGILKLYRAISISRNSSSAKLSLTTSRYSLIATFILSIASSSVFPCDQHPGNAGIYGSHYIPGLLRQPAARSPPKLRRFSGPF